jgi:hypothetical protein
MTLGVHKLDGTDVIVSISASREWGDELERAKRGGALDLHLLAGNIEILASEFFVTIGPFEGALILLPTIEVVARAFTQIRGGGPRIEIPLIGDDTSVWMLRKSVKDLTHVVLAYRGTQSPPIATAALDQATREAVDEFLKGLLEAFPLRRWTREEVSVLEYVVTVWPELQVSKMLAKRA